MESGYLNLAWAQALVDGLAAAGLREAVISPGSRSTPLALALLRQPRIRCHVVVDERCAGFFALGLGQAGGRPAALVCTSGSAPANWFPAVIEADEAAVPLLLLSADRPAELRGWGANQTVDQQNLFDPHVRASHALSAPEAGFSPDRARALAARIVAESCHPLPGPVHVNLPFREPLLPEGAWPDLMEFAPRPVSLPVSPPAGEDVRELAALLSSGPGVIVCGGGRYPAGFPQALARLAEGLAAPILAEPLAGLRFGSHDKARMLTRQEAFLRRPSFTEQHRPRWLLRFGAYPVSRSVQNWLAGSGALHILVAPPGRWPDPRHEAERIFHCDPLALCRALDGQALTPAPSSWGAAFAAEEARAARLVPDPGGLGGAPEGPDCFEDRLVPTLLTALPDGHRLFCGNSMAIRDLDSFSGTLERQIAVHGNRGASGIDGNIATAAGLAACGPTVALIGDVSAAHDIGALALLRGRPLVLVIINNGGGAIFGYLPQAALPDFERAWLTPPEVDFAHASAAFGLPFARVERLTAFRETLASALETGGPKVIEVRVDRLASLSRHRSYWQAVAGADREMPYPQGTVS